MSKLIRKVTYKLYPTTAQEQSLDELFVHHHPLYNWALRERIDAYKNDGGSLSYVEQSKINTL